MMRLVRPALLSSLMFFAVTGCTADSPDLDERDWPVIPGEDLLDEAGSIDELGDPRTLLARGNSTLYFTDWALNGLHRYDWATGELSEGTGLGQGPGEIRNESLTYLAPMEEGNLWLHDQQQRRITVYGPSLEPRDQMAISGTMRSLPLGDSLMASVTLGGEILLAVHDLREVPDPLEATDMRSAKWTYATDEREFFEETARNHVLKYGPATACLGEVIVGFEFASYLLRIQRNGIELLEEPQSLVFPVEPDLDEGQVRRPDWFNPRATLDLACNEEFIYALFSGRAVSRSEVRSLSGLAGIPSASDRMALRAEIERADRLHVYDRATGRFLHEIELPVEARRLAAGDDVLYLLVHEDDGPRILRYTWVDKYDDQ